MTADENVSDQSTASNEHVASDESIASNGPDDERVSEASDESSDERVSEVSGESSDERVSEASIETALRAGAALYTIGEYHAAHDPWEAIWLRLDGEDEQLFHGLIQLTAAVYHAENGNWNGASGLAESAVGYLSLGDAARGVRLPPLRSFCRTLADDPRVLRDESDTPHDRDPPALRIDGRVVEPSALSHTAVPSAARAIAEEYDYDVSVLDDAARFAREDRARTERERRREERSDETSRSDTVNGSDETNSESIRAEESEFTRFLRAMVVETDRRSIVFQRLAAHVDRRRRENDDVRDLFG